MFEFIDETAIGLPCGTTEKMLKSVIDGKINLHSLILMKGSEIFLEQYAPGFDESFKHRMYSVSKTYVSAAIGAAIEDGYFTLDTPVAEYFREKLPEDIHPYIQALTVKDCLMMATPFDETPYNHLHYDWISDFFTAKPSHRGGSLFHYDTGATLVLDELVNRATGKPFTEYLYDKVLRHIGYTEIPRCVEAPDGTLWGGSGIFATARELAAFARLWMNDGKNEAGKQLLPSWYVKEAVSKIIGNQETNQQNGFKGYGYGYQIWRHKYGWAMFGMGNQLALCYPAADLLLICTGDDQGNDFARSRLFDLIEDLLLPYFGIDNLQSIPAQLQMPLPMGQAYSPLQNALSSKNFTLKKNRTGMEKISFVFNGNEGVMNYSILGQSKSLKFGLGKYTEDVFPEASYSGDRINTPINRGYRCFCAALWDLPDLLVLKCYAADDYFGVFTLNVRFSKEGIDMEFTKKAEWFFDEYNGFLTGELS